MWNGGFDFRKLWGSVLTQNGGQNTRFPHNMGVLINTCGIVCGMVFTCKSIQSKETTFKKSILSIVKKMCGMTLNKVCVQRYKNM